MSDRYVDTPIRLRAGVAKRARSSAPVTLFIIAARGARAGKSAKSASETYSKAGIQWQNDIGAGYIRESASMKNAAIAAAAIVHGIARKRCAPRRRRHAVTIRPRYQREGDVA